MRTTTEGCISFPGLRVDVERPKGVKVEYIDIDGKKCTIKA